MGFRKMKKTAKLFGLSIGLSAVLVLTFFMIKIPYVCIIPFEPIPWIRIPEIIMGIVASIILVDMIWTGIKEGV